jgi:hypothetical protein
MKRCSAAYGSMQSPDRADHDAGGRPDGAGCDPSGSRPADRGTGQGGNPSVRGDRLGPGHPPVRNLARRRANAGGHMLRREETPQVRPAAHARDVAVSCPSALSVGLDSLGTPLGAWPASTSSQPRSTGRRQMWQYTRHRRGRSSGPTVGRSHSRRSRQSNMRSGSNLGRSSSGTGLATGNARRRPCPQWALAEGGRS